MEIMAPFCDGGLSAEIIDSLPAKRNLARDDTSAGIHASTYSKLETYLTVRANEISSGLHVGLSVITCTNNSTSKFHVRIRKSK
jgi:hypothetical protein